MKGYKVFKPDFTCRDMKFEIGEIFEVSGELRLCKNGIHFCKEANDCFDYYRFNSENIVCEVEAIGDVVGPEDGCSKVATNKIKILRRLGWEEVLSIVNTGKSNTGRGNCGHRNSSGYNSGDYNSGNCNSGDYNSGDCNSGHRNSSGCNSGDYNSGVCNSGNYNSGDCNSGDYNSGDCNSGYYNSGDYNSGLFNTDEPTIRMFNKDTGLNRSEIRIPRLNLKITEWVPESRMTDEQKKNDPDFHVTQGTLIERSYKEAWGLYWGEASKEDKQQFLNLPNFDAEIFEEITGIDITKEKL